MTLKEKLLDIKLVIDNEYLDKYCDLITNNLHNSKKLNQTQEHHIIPKYYYKKNKVLINNSESNLINLNYKDHILAHYYLFKCSSNQYYKYANICAIHYTRNANNVNEKEFVDSLDEWQLMYEQYRIMLTKNSHSLEVNARISATLSGRTSPNKNNIKVIEKRSRKSLTPKNKKLSDIASKRIGQKNSFYGKKHSQKTKDIIGAKNSKKVAMVDLQTNKVIKEFKSAIDAGRYLNNNNITSNKSANCRILKVCRGEGAVAYGFFWKFI